MSPVPGASFDKVRALPPGLAFRFLRQATATLHAADTPDAARQRLSLRADQALVRLVTTETRLRDVLAELAAGHLDRAESLLGTRRDSGIDSVDALAASVRALGERLPDSAPGAAAEIWDLLRDIAAADDTVRQALERAAAEVRDAGTELPAQTVGAGGPAEARPVDVASLGTYLGGRDWAGESAPRVTGVTLVVGGQSKHTYLVETDPTTGPLPWRSGVVLRMDTGYFDGSVLDEYALITRLFEAGVPVAEPLLIEGDPAAFGQPFMVSRRLDGKAAGMILDAVGASPDEAYALAEALGKLHAVPLERVVSSPSADLPQVVEEARQKIEKLWRETARTESVAVELGHLWIREHARLLAGQPPVTVHGDASLHNTLVDGGRLSGLLDWEFTHVGHPAEDLAYCRPAVERVADWDEFLRRYRESGGRDVSEWELTFFGAFCQLRNASLCAQVMDNVAAGRITTFDMFVTSIDTFARMEAVLAGQLHAAYTLEENQ